MIARLVSGGQSGVDRAALDVALELGIPCGGWCPRGRKAEDGTIPDRYPLTETSSAGYAQRTKWVADLYALAGWVADLCAELGLLCRIARGLRLGTAGGMLWGMSDVTHILSAIEQGDPSAAEQLLPLVYS
jgi:hypothetical protein